MNDTHQAIANRIVETFKAQLNAGVREQIPESAYEELLQMIRGALAAELNTAADLLEELVRRLRAQDQRGELGL